MNVYDCSGILESGNKSYENMEKAMYEFLMYYVLYHLVLFWMSL